MIKLDDVTYTYASQTLHFSFHVTKGERIAILGASGAGKSTLLSLIAGFIFPHSGVIELNGIDCTQLVAAKRPVSMLFQENNLFAHLTVAQNIGLGLNPALKLTAQQCLQRDNIIEQVGLNGLQQRLPSQLSGGQRQRAALARCLVRNRPILLLDEPFSALDEQLRKDMLNLVAKCCDQQTLTLLMVSHNPQDALAISQRTLMIDQGCINYDGDTQLAFQHKAGSPLT